MGKIRRPRTNHSNTIPRGETVDVFLRKKKAIPSKESARFHSRIEQELSYR